MNPITTGHLHLIEVLSKQPADAHLIFLSHTQDKKKNPLPYENKIKYAKMLIEPYFNNVQVVDSDARKLMDVLSILDKDYNEVILVAGGDRIDQFDSLLNQYNGIPDKKGNVLYNFDFIDVVSAGERDPEADDVSGMSASKMRAYVKEDNFEDFKKGIPTEDESLARTVFDDLKQHML